MYIFHFYWSGKEEVIVGWGDSFSEECFPIDEAHPIKSSEILDNYNYMYIILISSKNNTKKIYLFT